jgi:hypothetical protein
MIPGSWVASSANAGDASIVTAAIAAQTTLFIISFSTSAWGQRQRAIDVPDFVSSARESAKRNFVAWNQFQRAGGELSNLAVDLPRMHFGQRRSA